MKPILLLVLLMVISITSICTYNEDIEAASSNDSSLSNPDKISSFNFNYSKTGSAFGQQNKISYNSTSNILTVTSDEKPMYTIQVSEANESKLKDIFIKNEFLDTSGNTPFIPDSIFYSLDVEFNGIAHRVSWSHSSDEFVSQRLLKIPNEIVDFLCKSSTNLIACETVMLEFR